MVKKNTRYKIDLYHYILLIISIAAVGVSSGWEFRFSKKSENIILDIEQVREVFQGANSWTDANEDVFWVLSGNDSIGTGVLVEDNLGYGGRVPLLIGMVNDTIIKIQILPNNETDEFMAYIQEDRLLAEWEGMAIMQVPHSEVDAVSGATESSNAIIRGVRQGAASYLDEDQIPAGRSLSGIVKDLLFLVVILLSLLISYVRSLKRYRWVYLVIVLLVLGILTGKVLSLKLLYGWLSNGVAWRTNWQSALLLLMALSMPLLRSRKFYCNYLCPMGAFQELINKMTPVKRRTIKLKNSPIPLNEIYLGLIGISLVLGFTFELSYLEPFMVFMFRVAGTVLFIFVSVIAVMSFFFNKPWCTFCPTGCLINIVHKK